jgi:hypothetical protein
LGIKTEVDLARPAKCNNYKEINMNENNTSNKPELTIKSYKIVSNHDNEGTCSVTIETSAHTIIYPRAVVTFGTNQAIAFPVGFQIISDDNNVLFNYSLNLQPNTVEETTTAD